MNKKNYTLVPKKINCRHNNKDYNNNNSQCGSRFRGIWGDPAVGNLTPTGISTNREVDSLRPTKTVFEKGL